MGKDPQKKQPGRAENGAADISYEFDDGILERTLEIDPAKIKDPKTKAALDIFFTRTFTPARADWTRSLEITTNVQRALKPPYGPVQKSFSNMVAKVVSPDGKTVHEYEVTGDGMVERHAVKGPAHPREADPQFKSDRTAGLAPHQYRVYEKNANGKLVRTSEGGGGFASEEPGDGGLPLYQVGMPIHLKGRTLHQGDAGKAAATVLSHFTVTKAADLPSDYQAYFGKPARDKAIKAYNAEQEQEFAPAKPEPKPAPHTTP